MWKGKIIKPFFQFSPFLLQTFTCQCFLVYSAARCFVLSSYWTLWMVCTSWIVSIFGIIPAEILSITVDHTFVHLPFFLYEFNAFLHGTFFVAIFFLDGEGVSVFMTYMTRKAVIYNTHTHTVFKWHALLAGNLCQWQQARLLNVIYNSADVVQDLKDGVPIWFVFCY